MMDRDLAVREKTWRGRGRETDRRWLLTSVTVGIGALFSLPARAHPDNAAFNAPTRTLADLKRLGAEHQIRSIRYLSGSYHIVTADGKSAEFAEHNLRLRVDSSPLGPRHDKPVILPTGPIGDRASVFFAAPEEISALIKY